MRSSVNNRESQRPKGASTLVLGDSNWTCTWNDESRLVAAYTPDGDGFYAYDGQPRTRSDQDGRIEQSEHAQQPQGASTSGNVTTLVSTADGSVVASYDHSPFGLTVSQSGPAANANTYRFSTKPLDGTGLYYYGFRYYNPTLGRWISRDPIGERGGVNQLAFCTEDPVNSLDALGELAITGAWSWWPWGPNKPPIPKPDPKTKDWVSAAIKCGMKNFFSLIGTKLSDYVKNHYACYRIGHYCTSVPGVPPRKDYFFPEGGVSLIGNSSFTECMIKELVNGILPAGAPKLKYDPPKVTLYVRVGLQYACAPGGLVWGLRKAVRVKIDGEDSGWRSEEKYAAAGFCGKSGDHDAYCSSCSLEK